MDIENKEDSINFEEEKDVMSVDSGDVPYLDQSEREKVWKFWCHQCEQILDVDPRPRADGSLECSDCSENLVEKIAEDDEYLKARLEEQKEEQEEKRPQLEPSGRLLEIMRSLHNSENENGPNSPLQIRVIRRDGWRSGGSSEQQASPNAPPTDRRPSERRNPIRVFLSDLFSRNRPRLRGRRQSEAQDNDNEMGHRVHQINRIFMGGMPGTSPELNFSTILQEILGLESLASFGGERLNLSDFGVGFGGIADILDRSQRQGGHSGPPPAAKKVVDKLKEFEYSDDLKDMESACAVCKDDFKTGDKLIQFPCPNKHLYHPECIHPWLKLHNSCPVCRHELATDDEWYERMKQFRSRMDTESRSGPSDDNSPPPSGSGSSANIWSEIS